MQIREAVEERRISRRHLLSVCACEWASDGYGCIMMSSLSDAVVCAADKDQSQECCRQQMHPDWHWPPDIDWLIDTDSQSLWLPSNSWRGSIGEQQVKCAGHSAEGSWKQLIKSVNIHLVSFIIKVWSIFSLRAIQALNRDFKLFYLVKWPVGHLLNHTEPLSSEHWLCYALTSVWSEHVVCLWNEIALKGSLNVYKKRERSALLCWEIQGVNANWLTQNPLWLNW